MSAVVAQPKTGIRRVHAIGDVHGDYDRLCELMQEAGIIDELGRWAAENDVVIFIGDLTDRGPKGIEVVRLVRRLQEEAANAGGEVECLLGNHEALILCRAYELRGELAADDCFDMHNRNGGSEDEASTIAFDDDLFDWVAERPLMKKVGQTLYQHSDGWKFYLYLGSDLNEINRNGRELTQTATGSWRAMKEMTRNRNWHEGEEDSTITLDDYLDQFSVKKVVHGHTEHKGAKPLVYMEGKAINIDGSLSCGMCSNPERGFIYSELVSERELVGVRS